MRRKNDRGSVCPAFLVKGSSGPRWRHKNSDIPLMPFHGKRGYRGGAFFTYLSNQRSIS